MAIDMYLKTWDQGHLIEKFNTVTFDLFLAIPYKRAMAEYGERFAEQHLNLCNTLHRTLTLKSLADQPTTPRALRTPSRKPYSAPRAPTKKVSDLDSLGANVKRRAFRGRLCKKRLFAPEPAAVAQELPVDAARRNRGSRDTERRVSVKDRLGAQANRGPKCTVERVNRVAEEHVPVKDRLLGARAVRDTVPQIGVGSTSNTSSSGKKYNRLETRIIV